MNMQKLEARFSLETAYPLEPRFEAVRPSVDGNHFEQLKLHLLNSVLDEQREPARRKQLQLAANEAAALAWTTPYPLLFLPALFQEKARELREYNRRQEQVEETSQALLAAS